MIQKLKMPYDANTREISLYSTINALVEKTNELNKYLKLTDEDKLEYKYYHELKIKFEEES